MKFLGIDLGWQSGGSGLCCLDWQDRRLCLLALQRLDAIADILNWVDTWVPQPEAAVIAVDAPTLIPNETGMRLPDRLAHKHFGRYHAGCYPANLNRPFAKRTVGFGCSLEARGFVHAPDLQAQQPGRYQIEVFPHPATIRLFNLERILKYKKGKLAERRVALGRLRQHLLEDLPKLNPPLSFSDRAVSADLVSDIPEKGTELKALEDKLDSLTCAYVAAHWWYWGRDRNQVLGDRSSGYIIVPNPHPLPKEF